MALFISLSSPLALAIVGLRGAEWCVYAARGLGDRLLLIPQSSTQSSPPPTLGSSSPGLPARVHLATKVTQQNGVGTLESDA